jgi:hypothetical protein
MQIRNQEIRGFKCIKCGHEEILNYYLTGEDDPDRHICINCKHVFWWAHHNQTLFDEESQAAMPAENFQLIDRAVLTIDDSGKLVSSVEVLEFKF